MISNVCRILKIEFKPEAFIEDALKELFRLCQYPQKSEQMQVSSSAKSSSIVEKKRANKTGNW